MCVVPGMEQDIKESSLSAKLPAIATSSPDAQLDVTADGSHIGERVLSESCRRACDYPGVC